MKKSITIAAAFALTLTLGTTVFAASPAHYLHRPISRTANTGYCNYVDADNDGICDNCRNQYVHNGTTNSGHCSHVDANNDGICDNCRNQYAHNGAGCANGYANSSTRGYGNGHHGGNHHGNHH